MSEFEKVKAYIKDHNMISKNDSVIVGLSGGADSVCLLDMLCRLKEEEKFDLDIVGVHINHGIRGAEAQRDEQFSCQLCSERGIEFIVQRRDIPRYAREKGLSEEEAGRWIRYSIFEDIRRNRGGEAKIAVAHNLQDCVETFLHHLCRGTSLKGLAGISPVNGHIVRPVLCLSRTEIEQYLMSRDITYINDSTNFGDEYTRNRIRNKVLPYLTEYINAGAVTHIAEVAADIREADDYLNGRVSELFGKLFREWESGLCVNRKEFADTGQFMQKRLARLAVEKMAGGLKDITRRHIEDIVKLTYKQTGSYIMLPYGIVIRNEYEKMVFDRKDAQHQSRQSKSVRNELIYIAGKGTYQWDDITFEVNIIELKNREENIKFSENYLKNPQKMYTKCFDYDRINDVALLRTRKTGDYLVINEQGDRKKLKSYFIDEKLPAAKRDLIPCLADGSHIMWVYGYRVSEYYKVSKDTVRVMMVSTVCKGRQNA